MRQRTFAEQVPPLVEKEMAMTKPADRGAKGQAPGGCGG